MLEQLLGGGDTVELVGPNGEKIGTVTVEWPYSPPPDFKLPFTAEELEERRKDRTGLSFDEMWEEIKGMDPK